MEYLGGGHEAVWETMPVNARAIFNQKMMKLKYQKKKMPTRTSSKSKSDR